VVNDKLVFAKGYGYRDYEKKLPSRRRPLPDRLEFETVYRVSAGIWSRKEADLGQANPRVCSDDPFFNDSSHKSRARYVVARTGVTRHIPSGSGALHEDELSKS